MYAGSAGAADFSTDTSTWSQPPTSSNPSARYGHTGVYSNYGGKNEMIVFGGYGGGNLNDIHILDLDTEAWRMVIPSNPDSQDDNGDSETKCFDYDEEGTWAEVPCEGKDIPPKGPAKRFTHTSVYDNGSDTLYVMGGWQYNSVVFRDTWALNNVHTNPVWLKKDPMPTVGSYGVRNASAVWADGKIIVFGGVRDDDPSRVFSRFMIYDPGSNTWTPYDNGNIPGDDIPARYGHTAVWANGDMLVFGGRNAGHAYLNDVWILRNALTNPSWEELIPNSAAGEGNIRPKRRAGATGFYDAGKDQMLIFGGDTVGLGYSNDAWALKDAKNGGAVPGDWQKLSPAGPIPAERHFHAGVYDGSDDVVIFGGKIVGVGVSDDVHKLHFNVNYNLNVEKDGAGSGTVTGTGINCGNDCSESYSADTSVTLTANPAGGSIFAGWSGDCDVSGKVTMNADKTCTATFNLNDQTLTITKDGTGSGTVTGVGINCGNDCTESYPYNTSATLIANPSAGSTFDGWSGDPDCSDGIVTLNAAKTCTATFNLIPFCEADLKVNDADSATITSGSTALLEWCGSDVHTCANATSLKVGTTLGGNDISTITSGSWTTPALSASKTYYYECVNSAGDSSYDSVVVTVNATYTLTVTGGGGNGTVTGNGFNCTITNGVASGTCSKTYNSGDIADTLTPAAGAGHSFGGWSGGTCSGSGTCRAGSMTSNKIATATFTLNDYNLSITRSGSGSGTVTGAPAGINCGSTCSYMYPYNTSVTLTATAADGSIFAGWSGEGCTGTGTCTVTMTAARNVTARFNPASACENVLKVNDADSATITSGDSVTLEWCDINAHTCANASSVKVGDSFGSSNISTSLSGSAVRSPVSNTTYYYECLNSSGNPSYDNVVVTVSAMPQPDLIAMSLTTSGTLNAGNSIKFSGTIKNQGTANAGASSARFCIDNASCLDNTTGRVGSSDISVSALNSGATSGTFTSSFWTASIGSHTIYWCADTGKAVTEANELNNCTSATFTVNPASACENVLKVNDADSAVITSGDSVTLEWCDINAHTCANASSVKVGDSFGSSNISTSLSGSAVRSPVSNTTYYYECLNSSGNPSYDNVAVTVSAPLTNTITVTGAGSGNGKVTGGKNSFDTDINCTIMAGVTSGTCSASFSTGTSLQLVPAATLGSFSGWTDVNCSSYPGNCSVTLNTDKTVTASFNASNSAPVADAKITTLNSNPGCVADPESDAVNEGDSAYLWGDCSTDAEDGTPASYNWSCTGSPALTINNASVANTQVTSPLVSTNTTYTCTLTVTDNKGSTGTDSVTLNVNDIPPPDPDFAIDTNGPAGSVNRSGFGNVLIEPTNSDSITFKSRTIFDYVSEINNYMGGYFIERLNGFSGAVNNFKGYLRPCIAPNRVTMSFIDYYNCSLMGGNVAGINTWFSESVIPVSDPDQLFAGKLTNNNDYFENNRGKSYIFEVTANGSPGTRSSIAKPLNRPVFFVNRKPIVDFVFSQSGSQVSITNGDSDGDGVASYEPDAGLPSLPESYNFDKGKSIAIIGAEFDYVTNWVPSLGDKLDKCWVNSAYVDSDWVSDNCDMVEPAVPAGGNLWTYTYASPGDYDIALFLVDALGAYEYPPKLQSVSIASVNPLPDLVTNSLIINGPLTENTSLTFSGIVKNQGALDAPASDARFCLDNPNCLTDSTGQVGTNLAVPLLASGADSGYLTSNASWTATAGNHTLYLCADVSVAVSESDEANNCTAMPFTISATPSTLKVCVGSCNGGGSDQLGSTIPMIVGNTLNLKACYNSELSCVDTIGTADVTGSTTWTETNSPADAVGVGAGTGVITANNAGTEKVDIDYLGNLGWFNVNVSNPAVCGDGSTDFGEDCDEGPNNGVCPKTCSASCTNNSCSKTGDWKEIAP